MTLALEEILTNIIRHGYDDGGAHEIDMVIRKQGDLLTLQVAADGRPFDPSRGAPPNLDLPADQRAVGGLGIHLVKSLTDALEYRREGGRNVVTVEKKIASAPSL